jgi:hypothetical protein
LQPGGAEFSISAPHRGLLAVKKRACGTARIVSQKIPSDWSDII